MIKLDVKELDKTELKNQLEKAFGVNFDEGKINFDTVVELTYDEDTKKVDFKSEYTPDNEGAMTKAETIKEFLTMVAETVKNDVVIIPYLANNIFVKYDGQKFLYALYNNLNKINHGNDEIILAGNTVYFIAERVITDNDTPSNDNKVELMNRSVPVDVVEDLKGYTSITSLRFINNKHNNQYRVNGIAIDANNNRDNNNLPFVIIYSPIEGEQRLFTRDIQEFFVKFTPVVEDNENKATEVDETSETVDECPAENDPSVESK